MCGSPEKPDTVRIGVSKFNACKKTVSTDRWLAPSLMVA